MCVAVILTQIRGLPNWSEAQGERSISAVSSLTSLTLHSETVAPLTQILQPDPTIETKDKLTATLEQQGVGKMSSTILAGNQASIANLGPHEAIFRAFERREVCAPRSFFLVILYNFIRFLRICCSSHRCTRSWSSCFVSTRKSLSSMLSNGRIC